MSETMTIEKSRQYWAAIREAIRGTEQDFTEGSLPRAIVLLAIPMVLEMFMESLFAIANTFWVAHLGSNAIATVGITEAILTLMYCVAMGFSLAMTAMVARRIGEKDPDGAAIATVQGIVVGVVAATLMGVAGALFAPQLLAIMGASPEVIATGRLYASIVLGGGITVVMIFLNNAVFRGAGDAAIAMRVLWVSNLINLMLDPCLIFGIGPFPELGLTGAAVSTTCGRSIGVIYQLLILWRGTGRVKIRARHLRLDWDVMFRLIRVSWNGMFQFGVGQMSWIVLVRLVGGFGSVAVAGYTVAIRIFLFIILPSWGLATAAATLVGQNLGALKPERAERSVWLTGFYNMLFLGGVGLILIIFPEPVIRLFTDDPEVVSFGVNCLRIVCYGNLAYAYGMVMVQSFNGAGDTFTPTMVNVFGYWVLQIPLAYALAFGTHLGANGVFAAIPIAETVIAIIGVILFRQGRWKVKRI
jgi:putative MATE family efflux protein